MAERIFPSKLVGVSYKNDDGSSRQDYIESFASAGKPLILRREPKNKYDKNAIAVFVESKFLFFGGEWQLGYLDGHAAGELAPLMDTGVKISAIITAITGSEGKNRGVNIEIRIDNG